MIESLQGYAEELRLGNSQPPRAHIERARRPASSQILRASRLAEVWTSGSSALILLASVSVILFRRDYLFCGLAAIVALLLSVETTFRGRLTRVVSSVTPGLAVIATVVLAYECFSQILIVVVLAIGPSILWDNLREMRK